MKNISKPNKGIANKINYRSSRNEGHSKYINPAFQRKTGPLPKLNPDGKK